MPKNNIQIVREVIDDLKTNDINVLLGGGWAEELLGIKEPREHGDIDLYYPASDFTKLERYISKNNLKQFKDKPHKKAFYYKDVPVEVILIQSDSKGHFSHYQNPEQKVKSKVIRWPADLKTTSKTDIPCLSIEVLQFKRKIHLTLFPDDELKH